MLERLAEVQAWLNTLGEPVSNLIMQWLPYLLVPANLAVAGRVLYRLWGWLQPVPEEPLRGTAGQILASLQQSAKWHSNESLKMGRGITDGKVFVTLPSWFRRQRIYVNGNDARCKLTKGERKRLLATAKEIRKVVLLREIDEAKQAIDDALTAPTKIVAK